MPGVLKARVGGLWVPIGSGSAGNVIGPSSAVDGDIVLYDGTTGKLIKDSGISISNFTLIVDSPHATRPDALSFPKNTLLYETDRTVWFINTGAAWKWTHGQCVATFENIPADLTNNDVGFICQVAYYSHALWWGGSSWVWAPGENGSGYFMETPFTQDAYRWAYCDGHTTTLLMLDPLREQSFLTPDLVGVGAYKKTGPVYGLAGQDFSQLLVTIGAAGVHGHGGSYTDTTGGHSHTATADAVGAHSHGGTTGDALNETQGVLGGVSIGHAKPGVPGEPEIWYQHKHAINLHGHAIGADGAHSHNVSMNIMGAHSHGVTLASDGNHTHTATVAGDLNLRRVELLPFIRR